MSYISRLKRRDRSPVDTPLPARIIVGGRSFTAASIDQFVRTCAVEAGATVKLIIDSFSREPDTRGAALVQIEALDAAGQRMPIPGWKHVSDRVREYQYLEPGDQQTPATTVITVKVPYGATSLRFTGHRWKQATHTATVGDPIVHVLDEGMPPLASPTGAALAWSGADFRVAVDVPEGASLASGHFYVTAQEIGTSPLCVSLLDADGAEMLLPEGLPVNPKFGTFVPLKLVKGEEARTDFEIALPEGVRTMCFVGQAWGKRTATFVGAPTIDFTAEHSGDALREFLDSLSGDDELLVIDTTAPPLGHDTLALRPNNLAIEYARAGVKVLFVPFSSTQDQPAVIDANCAQVQRSDLDSVLNILLAKSRDFKCTYICSSFPSYECLTRMERLRRHGWRTIYEIRDDMEEFNRVGYSKWYHPLLESQMGSIAGQIVTVSTALSNKIQVMSRPLRDPQVIPNGVSQSTLDQSVHLRQDDAPSGRSENARVGYVGHLTASWFDWPALIKAARSLPAVSFDIVGHGKPDSIQLPSNIDYHGPMTHDNLLQLVPTWKVGLIPFVDSPLTRGVDPNKIYEYYAWGLRVVTAKMGAVASYPSTWVYTGADELTKCVEVAQSTPMSVEEISAIREFAERSSWRDRAEAMLELMEARA